MAVAEFLDTRNTKGTSKKFSYESYMKQEIDPYYRPDFMPSFMRGIMEAIQHRAMGMDSSGALRPEVASYLDNPERHTVVINQTNKLDIKAPLMTESKIRRIWDDLTAEQTAKILAQTNVGPH